MTITTIQPRAITIPSLREFAKRNPHLRRYIASREGRWLFRLLMNQIALHGAEEATTRSLPALAGVAERIVHGAIRSEINCTRHMRTCAGALICALLEANGYEISGGRRHVYHPLFVRAQMYS